MIYMVNWYNDKKYYIVWFEEKKNIKNRKKMTRVIENEIHECCFFFIQIVKKMNIREGDKIDK